MEMLGADLRGRGRDRFAPRAPARRRAHDSGRGAEVRARGRRHASTRTGSGRRLPRSPATRVYVTKPLGTGLIMSGHKKGEIGTQQLERAVRWMKTLNKDAAEVLRAHNGERGHRRHRLRPLRARPRDGRAKRRPHPPRVGALPGDRRGARSRAQGHSHERRPSQPRLRRTAPDAEGVPETLVALGYDPQTAGGLLVSLPPSRAPCSRPSSRLATSLPAPRSARSKRAPASSSSSKCPRPP